MVVARVDYFVNDDHCVELGWVHMVENSRALVATYLKAKLWLDIPRLPWQKNLELRKARESDWFTRQKISRVS